MAPFNTAMSHLKSFGGMVNPKMLNFGHSLVNKVKQSSIGEKLGVKKLGETVSKMVDPKSSMNEMVSKVSNFASKKIPGFEGMQSDFNSYLGKRKADINSLDDSVHKKIKKGVDDANTKGTGFAATNLMDSMHNALPGILKKPMV